MDYVYFPEINNILYDPYEQEEFHKIKNEFKTPEEIKCIQYDINKNNNNINNK